MLQAYRPDLSHRACLLKDVDSGTDITTVYDSTRFKTALHSSMLTVHRTKICI